jgi:hypothetical protein
MEASQDVWLASGTSRHSMNGSHCAHDHAGRRSAIHECAITGDHS